MRQPVNLLALRLQWFESTPAQVLAKKKLTKGRDWARDAMKQLVAEKKLAKSRQKNPEGQAFVFYHLPTPLEPATGDNVFEVAPGADEPSEDFQ
jgi:hypothetical protein